MHVILLSVGDVTSNVDQFQGEGVNCVSCLHGYIIYGCVLQCSDYARREVAGDLCASLCRERTVQLSRCVGHGEQRVCMSINEFVLM